MNKKLIILNVIAFSYLIMELVSNKKVFPQKFDLKKVWENGSTIHKSIQLLEIQIVVVCIVGCLISSTIHGFRRFPVIFYTLGFLVSGRNYHPPFFVWMVGVVVFCAKTHGVFFKKRHFSGKTHGVIFLKWRFLPKKRRFFSKTHGDFV